MPEAVSDSLNAAVIQLCSGSDRRANLAKAAALIASAAGQGAALVVLPENFSLMGVSDREKRRLAEAPSDSRVLDFLAGQAALHRVTIIGGTLLLKTEQKQLRNACPVFGSDGKLIAFYDKIHLFDMNFNSERYCESELVTGGDKLVEIDLDGFKIGVSICYDLRFPELYRAYADAGCDLLCNVAAFTEATGRAHWQTLLKARAIENQSYMLAAGQWGEHPDGRRTWGNSMIVDPWGEVESVLAEGEGVVFSRLTKARLNAVRRALPALRHRRL